MTTTKTLTHAEASDLLAFAFPYAEAGSMDADALALAALATDTALAPTFFELAAGAVAVNTLAFRRFMIGHARDNGLSAGRWRVFADHLPSRLMPYAPQA